MNKYEVKLYPNQDSFTAVVEAESIEEAISQAEDIAGMNCCFIATEKDVELIRENVGEEDD